MKIQKTAPPPPKKKKKKKKFSYLNYKIYLHTYVFEDDKKD